MFVHAHFVTVSEAKMGVIKMKFTHHHCTNKILNATETIII